jgi:hypothetical protein
MTNVLLEAALAGNDTVGCVVAGSVEVRRALNMPLEEKPTRVMF